MGVQGQHADVAGVVMYLEQQPALLFGAVMSILRRNRPDIRIEEGMVRIPANDDIADADLLRDNYADAAVNFQVPPTALTGLYAKAATPDDESPCKLLRIA